MKRLFIFLFFLTFLGCTNNSSSPDQSPSPRDPQIPGGIIGNPPGVESVSGLKIDSSKPLEITLTWNNPIKYQSLDFSILILRKACDLNSLNCSTPSPTSPGSLALYKVWEGKGTAFVDDNVQSGITYSYFVYVGFSGDYSAAQSVSATAESQPLSLSNLTAYNFWPNTLWRIGQSSASLSSGTFAKKISNEGELQGQLALGANGAVAYLADTENNRIVVLIKQVALSCMEGSSDPLLQQACLFSAKTEPFVPFNVLGQPNQNSNLSCQGHDDSCKLNLTASACANADFCAWEGVSDQAGVCRVRKNECLTKPTHVLVDGDKLLVADSGNDRVLIYQAPLRDGCDTDTLGSDFIIVRNCTAEGVIGKKSVLDLNSYTLQKDGRRILSKPGALATKDGSLFIADRGHHRVVRAKKYLDSNIFACAATPLKTSQGYDFSQVAWDTTCGFDLALGQNGFFEQKTFKDIVKENGKNGQDVISPLGAANFLNPAYQDLLKRYFFDTASILFSGDGKVLLASNEQFSLTTPEIRQWGQADFYDLNFKTQSSMGLNQTLTPVSGDMSIDFQSTNQTLIYTFSNFQEPSLCTGQADCSCTGTVYAAYALSSQPVTRPSSVLATTLILTFDLKVDVTKSLLNANCPLTNQLLKDRTLSVYLDPEQNMTLLDLNRQYQLSPLVRSNFYSLYYRRIDSSPIALKGRILRFDENIFLSDPPVCDATTFNFGNCDAEAVMGQLDFKTLPVFTEGSNLDYRNSVSYGLTSISDMALTEKSLLVTDNVTNDIYFFKDYMSSSTFDFHILNPLGAAMPLQPTRAQPNLKSLSSIVFDPFTDNFLLSDPGAGYVYQVRKP